MIFNFLFFCIKASSDMTKEVKEEIIQQYPIDLELEAEILKILEEDKTKK